MIKVAIFENEREYCEPVFSAVNIAYFGGQIEYTWCNTSQEFGNIEDSKNFDIILVDLELSPQTQLDGFRILQELLKHTDKSKIMLLTGSSRINERLAEKSLPNFSVIKKPVRPDDVKIKFEKSIKK